MTPPPRLWGWPVRGGGRAANVEPGTRYAATTSQACGLYPFAVSAGCDVRGVPVGRHLHTAEPVGLDPAHWLRTGLVSNTSVWIQGQPGIGKSSITKRLVTGLVGFGMRAVVPGDVKGEYTPLITALGGTVWRLGRGHHALNPLHAPPGADPETRRARTLSLLDALISIVARRDPDPVERRLLAAALDIALDATTADRQATIPDLLRILTAAPSRLVRLAGCVDEPDYDRLTRQLTATLGLLCDGPLRGLFDRPSTVEHDPDAPALSLDLSALADDDDVIASAMLCAWTWTASHIDAGRRNIVQVQDELWRALRVAPGLVEKSDRITRLGRHQGIVSIQVTHSLDDLEALPTEADRAKARGLVSRTGIVVLGGMADRELDPLARITPLTEGERALVTSWAAPPTWHPGHRHPGRGKYLIKSGQRLGLPVALTLTPSEIELHDTDTAFHRGRS